MTTNIYSDRPDFIKDMQDVVDVFASALRLPGDAALEVHHSGQVLDGQRHCRIRLSGALEGEASSVEAVQPQALLDKRVHKRQVKLALYHALKRASGYHPPWGALTGIRPTRLVYEAMDEGLTLNKACGRMMDVFDVRPENAGLLVEVVSTQQSLPQAGEDEVDIYIGVPFCPSRCRYCSFISRQVGKGEWLEPYTQALLREIRGAVELVEGTGLRPRAFYMGGGTPTVLSADQLAGVLDAAQPLMRPARERSVEAGRPDSMAEDKLLAIRAAGVERVCVNPQTSFDSTLAAIGRAHTKCQAEQAFALARSVGFERINMDLIAGLPGEDVAMFEQTLDWVEGLGPENLTVHTLCVKRSSDMHRLMDSLPDGEQVAYMVQLGRSAADSMGMRPYYLYRQKHMAGNQANVGYALPQTECLYNVDTMEDNVSVLAMGAGGISKHVTKGRVIVKRAPNVKEVQHYIARVDEMIERKRALFATTDSAGHPSP